ncbi:MAG: hypothetical protein C0594_13470 [Marinilabiliales bacterium]|nr:MAG: hypothetical protein C0594_13470 [Marinilabiliales bacterium]
MESVWLEFLPGPHYTITDQNGNYFLYLDVGNYTASQYQINPLFDQTCLPGGEQTIEVLQVGDTVSNVDFANSADIYCPDLTVDIAAGVIRPCMQAQYTVQFSNHGTYPADNATIDIELPPEMTYVYAPWPSYQNGDLLTFDVFTINPGVTETFNIVVDVACDLELIGTTLCVEAHIHPDDPCVAPDPSWDHSSVAVEGSCEDSLACFNIENTGDPSGGDMQSTSEYRIYENNTLVYTGSFQLNGGESIDICWPANGNSIRLEADQHPAHPGNSHPQDIVEMCGDSLNGYVASLVNTVPQDDIDEFVEIFCLEVTASYDPNDKQVFPTGITEEHHYIDSSDVLEYFIRFQNTGNDTAFNIYVIDTISQYLEIASITPGVSSHPYYIEALSNEVVQFVFSDIMLPDSSTNEIASHGFVKFKINQKPGNPKGTVITNSAGIVFDYNIPVVTNTVFNTIGESNGIITSTPNVYDETVNIDVYPNPFSETTKFEVSNYNQSYSFHLYDITGREVSRINEIQSPSFTLNRNKIDNGVYIYKIVSKQKLIGSGKLIIQ